LQEDFFNLEQKYLCVHETCLLGQEFISFLELKLQDPKQFIVKFFLSLKIIWVVSLVRFPWSLFIVADRK